MVELWNLSAVGGVEETPDIPIPPPQSIWEYIILLVLSGGGALAVKQFFTAYKNWQEMRRTELKQVEIDRDSVVERVVDMLQEQLDDQSADYSARLADKDRYYSEELARRSKITEENFIRKNQAISDIQDDNRRLRRLLARYQERYGYLRKETGYEETEEEDESEQNPSSTV